VIAILTKFEALVEREKGRYKDYVKKNVFNPLKSVTHTPAAIVQTHRESFIGNIIIITT
jgi:hypothetical protein